METTQTQAAVDPKDVKKYQLFKTRIINSNYVFKDGTQAQFKGGMYATDNQVFIDELQAEIAAGHMYIYQEAGQELLSANDLDPEIATKRRIIAEYLAEQEKLQKAGTTNFGESEQGKLNALNSLSIKDITAGGSK